MHFRFNCYFKSVLYSLILLATTSCGKFDYGEEQRRENFNKNYEVFRKLEEMQREDIHVFAIGLDAYHSFEPPRGLEEAIANGYSYKQNNIDRNKLNATSLHYTFKRNIGLSDNRWNEYKQLLTQANLSQFIYTYDRPDKRQLRFYENQTRDLGYVYMEFPPPKFCLTFKDCQPIMPSQTYFIYLRKNWYLFNERFRLEQD